MKIRRGQAALEFLSTYGFAFLIILVMVGALTYFGVLNPGSLVPGSCRLGENIKCTDYQARAGLPAAGNARLQFAISNNRGKQISIFGPGAGAVTYQSAVAQPYGSTIASGCLIGPTTVLVAPANQIPANGYAMPAGAVAYVQCDMTLGPSGAGASSFPVAGETIKAVVSLQFNESGGAYPHPFGGEITAKLS